MQSGTKRTLRTVGWVVGILIAIIAGLAAMIASTNFADTHWGKPWGVIVSGGFILLFIGIQVWLSSGLPKPSSTQPTRSPIEWRDIAAYAIPLVIVFGLGTAAYFLTRHFTG